jgi:hypothetical protein
MRNNQVSRRRQAVSKAKPQKEDSKPCRFWADQDGEWGDRQDIEQRLLRKGIDICGLDW